MLNSNTSPKPGYRIAPAGCGKTTFICQQAKSPSQKPKLILTHTHAGVESLLSKLREKGCRSSNYRVDTICAWSKYWCSSFPATTGYDGIPPEDPTLWDKVVSMAADILTLSWAKDIVRTSFSSAYIDEYQDCTLAQHRLAVAIGHVIPTEVVGDPLQGIFNFGASPIVDWERDVKPCFEERKGFDYPWRWKKGSKELGQWLIEVRKDLLGGRHIDLQSAPASVQFISIPSDPRFRITAIAKECLKALTDVRRVNESLVVIAAKPWLIPSLSKNIKGALSVLEPIECKELIATSKSLDLASRPIDYAKAVVQHVQKCVSGLNAGTLKLCNQVIENPSAKIRSKKYEKPLIALQALCIKLDDTHLALAAKELSQAEGVRITRRELLDSFLRTAEEHVASGGLTYEEAARVVRSRVSRGRDTRGRRILSHTLLIKGLEFDNAIVVDADLLTMENLYVALTRPKNRLIVLGTSPILSPESTSS